MPNAWWRDIRVCPVCPDFCAATHAICPEKENLFLRKMDRKTFIGDFVFVFFFHLNYYYETNDDVCVWADRTLPNRLSCEDDDAHTHIHRLHTASECWKTFIHSFMWQALLPSSSPPPPPNENYVIGWEMVFAFRFHTCTWRRWVEMWDKKNRTECASIQRLTLILVRYLWARSYRQPVPVFIAHIEKWMLILFSLSFGKKWDPKTERRKTKFIFSPRTRRKNVFGSAENVQKLGTAADDDDDEYIRCDT